MTEHPDTNPPRTPDAAPSTEADPAGGEDVWVTVRHGAEVVDRTETWVRRQCRSGWLPCRTPTDRSDGDLLVPLGPLLDLASRTESD
jgi:hypothetical protein